MTKIHVIVEHKSWVMLYLIPELSWVESVGFNVLPDTHHSRDDLPILFDWCNCKTPSLVDKSPAVWNAVWCFCFVARKLFQHWICRFVVFSNVMHAMSLYGSIAYRVIFCRFCVKRIEVKTVILFTICCLCPEPQQGKLSSSQGAPKAPHKVHNQIKPYVFSKV